MTKQNNSVRKAEVTPSIRERAERLRDAAGRFIRRQPVGLAKVAPEDVRMAATASPVLVSQVSEWSALQAYMTTTSPVENEDLDEKLNRANELHARICAFEVHSLADMAAKLPVYEDEHDDLKRFDSGAQIERAWDSVIRDIKAVSGRATLAPAPDPILAAILETQRLTVARTAALNLELPPGTIDPTPEQDAATDAFFAHVDGVLLKTVPTTAAGCAALARYAVEFLEAEGFVLDEQGSEHVRILKLIARSPLLQGATANHAAPDPVFDAIDRYRIAREAWDAYSDRIERDGWDALGASKQQALWKVGSAMSRQTSPQKCWPLTRPRMPGGLPWPLGSRSG